ncbi:hypothetical protein CEY16_03220 [Halalkalibacillus sediminis]|uniref:CHY-type domain-containing protein n=1 Tax=Halalkalibacillus sediminis TaxID=2018042 RepID=A0A2I0QWU6_9BACI|nr:CHY zinc finger protein [Halalkalibacillus sediminis]PKR78779.1 hypothetical protein CEY16_03220 [Halalkalibacillus sediminis]
MKVKGTEVKGKIIDQHTRCAHYHSELDIIAIRFKCCDTYYPCYYCHEEEADHSIDKWNEEDLNEKAILCGTCGEELTISSYLKDPTKCHQCGTSFNPNCQLHHHLYFNID